jgi:hypothetical protein
MTSPGDDGFEEALRRALSDAASEVEPGADGLDKIRARIGDRPPRPWLLSVISGLADRVRHWTWRGHWSWQDSLPRLSALWERRSRRGNFRGQGVEWVRFVTVLAGVAVLAAIALGVQPFRHAILQAGSSLNEGGGPTRSSAGTEGNATQAANGSTPTTATVASGGGPSSQARTSASGRAAAPHPTSSARCVSGALPVLSAGQPSQATVAAKTGGTSSGTSSSGTSSATRVASPLSSGSSRPAEPVYTSANVPTCPVGTPTGTPTPTPTSSSASLVPTPSDDPSTQWSAPSWSDPTPTPTASGSSPSGDPSNGDPANGDPSSSAPDPPSRSWESWQQRRPADHRDQHHRRR